MVEVSSSTYDPDGDVTATTEYVDSNPADAIPLSLAANITETFSGSSLKPLAAR